MDQKPPQPRKSLLLRRWPFPVVLALRYLKSARRDAFVTTLSVVAVAGIAVGVAAMILFMAALSGLHDRLLAQVLATTPELAVELAPELEAPAVAEARRIVAETPGIAEAQITLEGTGWILLGDSPQPVTMVGFEGTLPASFRGATVRKPGLYVPARLAKDWLLVQDQALTVVSPRPTLNPLSIQPRTRSVALAGTFEASSPEALGRIAVPLQVAASLFGSGQRRIEAATGAAPAAALARALAVAPELSRRLEAAPGLPAGTARVRTWRDLNQSLYFVLRLEKALMFVAVGLIVVVAALALVIDLALLIASKRAEIGMLGALGARARQVRAAFLTLGALLASGGIALGTALGVAGAWVFDHWQLFAVPGHVMFVDYIPFRITAPDLVLVLGVSGLLVVGSSLYAAHRAAALSPMEAVVR